MVPRPALRAALAAALALTVVACGGDDDSAEPAGPTTTAPLEVSTGGGTVQVNGADGGLSYQADDDGNVAVESDDGGSTTIGAGAVIPDGWPAEVRLPDGAVLSSATTSGAGDDLTLSVTATVAASVDDVHRLLVAHLTSAGYRVSTDELADSEQGPFGLIAAGDGVRQVTATAGEGPTEGRTTFSITVLGPAT